MQPLAHMVSQPAHGQHIRGAIECQAVVEVQPLAGHYLGGDRLKARVVGAKGCGLGGRCGDGLHTGMIPEIGVLDHLLPVSTPSACGSTSTPS